MIFKVFNCRFPRSKFAEIIFVRNYSKQIVIKMFEYILNSI